MGPCNKGGSACEECTQKCLLIHHGRKDPSPIVTSFFKVMIGDRFSTVLFIPPKFARTIASLVNQGTFLEDPKGRRWRVTLSTVDGSLAILQGWREFASAHSLRIGDFVVFNYIAGSHFVVQIYGSSGSERLKFSEKRYDSRGKITRTKHPLDHLPSDARNTSASNLPSEMTDKEGSVNRQGSNSTIQSDFDAKILGSKTDANDVAKVKMNTEMSPHGHNSERTPQPVQQVAYTEVPFYMFDRNSPDRQGASGASLFDLSNYEMPNMKSSGTEKKVPRLIEKGKSPLSDVIQVDHQTTLKNNHVEEHCQMMDEEPVGKDGENNGVPIDISISEVSKDVPDFKMNKRKYHADHADKVPLATGESSCFTNIFKQLPTMSNGALKRTPFTEERNRVASGNDPVRFQRRHTPQESGGRVPQIRCNKNPVTMQARDNQAGKVPGAVKRERFGSAAAFSKGEPPVIVKVEPEEKSDYGDEFEGLDSEMEKNSPSHSSPHSVDFFCSVPAVTQSFLELPMDLPSFACRGKKSNPEKKIVVLQDSAMRKWPVLYHEKSAFRVLTSGWEALAKANNIQEGDICSLTVENESESLLQILIQRKDSSE